MDYRDNRQRWAESHQVVHFYAGQWCTFTPALTDVLADGVFELLRGAMDTASQLLFGEWSEEALDVVQPGSTGWREVYMPVRTQSQPTLDGRGL